MAVTPSRNRLYRFGEFQVDVKNRLLMRGSEIISVTPKVFDLLLLLVENRGSLLEKDELMEQVWGTTFVEEANLARNISFLRKALGEHPKDPQYIVTVAGHGYRFVAPVQEFAGDSAQLATPQQVDSPRAAEDEAPDYILDGAVPTGSASLVPKKTKKERRNKRLALLAASAFLVVLVVPLAFITRQAKMHQPAMPAPELRTIAVLPSKPSAAEDRDPASEFGLAASLINRLSGVRSLIVRPAAAIVKYTSIAQDPIEAGLEQQVNYVLASSYQKSGEKIMFTAQLINVHDRSVLWSDACEQQCNTFAWQDALAEKTTRSLLTTLSEGHRNILTKHGTENQKAYDLFNLGLYGWYTNTYNTDGLYKSAAYLEQAIALDPNYAAAYALLAVINSRIGLAFGSARKEYDRKAVELARKALELDETAIDAHLVLGVSAYSYDWDWAGAEEHFKRARELNPDDVEVSRTYAAYLASLGRLDESVFWQQRACDLQPLSFDLNAVLVMRLFIARRYQEAIQQARKSLQMIPAPQTLYYEWRCCEQAHMFEEAYSVLQELMAAEKVNGTASLVERAYAASGYEKARTVYLRHRLKDLVKRSQEERFNPVDAAISCAALGDRDGAFRWLEEAYRNHAQGLIYLKVNPEFDNLRSDARFANLVGRIGLP